jgi:hypothetical protein
MAVDNVARTCAHIADSIDSFVHTPSRFIEAYQQARYSKKKKAGGHGRSARVAGNVAAAALVAAASFTLGWLLRRRRACNAIADSGVSQLIAEGYAHDPPLRDCCDGETHDLIVVETQQEVTPVVDNDVDAPPGIAVRRGPASRRIAVRKKYVHEEVRGNIVNGPFLGWVVAQARLVYNGRDASSHNKALARAFMVRKLQEAGVRPQHIDEHIDQMVLAVFFLTENQIKMEKHERNLRRDGRLRNNVGE